MEAWIAVGGATAGVVLSALFVMLADLVKSRRETGAALRDRLIESIILCSEAVKGQSRTALRVAATFWPTMSTNPLSAEEGRRLLAKYEDDRVTLFERLLLFAPSDVVRSARLWQQDVRAMHPVADADSTMTREDFQALLDRASKSRHQFHLAARTALHIPGSLDAPPPRLSADDNTWQLSELGE
jgi:hypothetical protein